MFNREIGARIKEMQAITSIQKGILTHLGVKHKDQKKDHRDVRDEVSLKQ